MCFIRKDQRVVFLRKNLKKLTSLLKKYLGMSVFSCLIKGLLAIVCSNFFSNLKVNQILTVAYSQMFDHMYIKCWIGRYT